MKGGPPTNPPLPPAVEIRYGPFAQPLWSKVAGPFVISGMKRWKRKKKEEEKVISLYLFLILFFCGLFFPHNHLSVDDDKYNSPKNYFSMSTLSNGLWSRWWTLFMTSIVAYMESIVHHHCKTSTPWTKIRRGYVNSAMVQNLWCSIIRLLCLWGNFHFTALSDMKFQPIGRTNETCISEDGWYGVCVCVCIGRIGLVG